MNAEGSAEEPSAGAEQSDPEPRHLARRSLLTAAGVVGVAGVAAVSGGLVWRDDVANARQHADGATTAELSTATSLKVLWRANTTHKVMALTFDDGPGPTLTSPLLDVLAENKVRATFSLVGRRAHLRKDLVRRQMRQGHELANHTWSHQDLSQIGPAAQQRELESTDQILYDLTGRKPAVIRPPYGRINGDLLAYAARNAQQIVLWDMRFHESLYDSAGNAQYVMDHLRPGSILLGHDAGSRNRYVGTQAVPAIIRMAKDRGYEFLTASEMLELDARG